MGEGEEKKSRGRWPTFAGDGVQACTSTLDRALVKQTLLDQQAVRTGDWRMWRHERFAARYEVLTRGDTRRRKTDGKRLQANNFIVHTRATLRRRYNSFHPFLPPSTYCFEGLSFAPSARTSCPFVISST